jgi:hypothetical protein
MLKRLIKGVGILILCVIVVLLMLLEILSQQNRDALSRARLMCQPDRVFRVINADQWTIVKSSFANKSGASRDSNRLETPVAQWKEVPTTPGLMLSTSIIKSNGIPVLVINDVAYAPRSFLSEIGLAQRVVAFHCIYDMDNEFSNIFFNFGKA